jgi:molybdopterin converting factor subunit 1
VVDLVKSIRVQVVYFGRARDIAGGGKEEFSFPSSVSVDALLSKAESRHKGLASLRKSIRVAVNESVTSTEVSLRDGDVVAILPPIAGG